MAGNDDLIARLRKKVLELLEHRHATDGWMMQESATALAERDATIERLTKVAEQAQEDRRTLRYEVACLRSRAETAERERDEAREQLRMQWCLACGSVSADGKCDCTDEPDTANLREAVDYATEFGKMVREVTRERDEARAEVERKDAALAPFADMADYIDAETEGVSDADEVDVMFHDFLFAHWPVSHFRSARAALTAKGGENEC